MESSQQRYRSQLETTPWFRGLPIGLRDYLVSHASLVTLERGEFLYRRGEPSDGLYAVLGGALAIGTVGVDGKEALLAVLGPTAWLGEISLFDGLPRPNDAAAVSRTLLLHVPEIALQSVLESTPRYWRDFALLMAQRLRVSFENTEAMTLLPAAQRVANRLLVIAGGYGGLNAPQSRIRISQDSLASMVSLSRQTTNQLLRNLENQRILVLKSGEIAILDFDRLRAASLGDPDP
ncbi:CRP-like cAMP-activated global transcriptional regulator [Paraburkholderia ultramafica]|uniref:CRP-like cAMP-activated global transcriptional regulator n=1 Tax=Paraburkholderia ultramafica TaxID=1544867 RepID=A0A6S7BRJ2_9BURK|nr:Crp/Fnr family transcriptional regulator [Paraburkholderia ultramafica]CAB3792881.1 CRP-like cAMP-activated global transcriptional regulator [Paraburkholderia ultramafica]